MHVPPVLASTLHSVATGGPPCSQVLSSATNRCGGCHAVIAALDTMPPPKSWATAPPTRASTLVGTNHAEMPGPVAIAFHTSSGVPVTSTSTWTLRRPDGSFLTLMSMAPWLKEDSALTGRADGRGRRAGADARPSPLHRDSAPRGRRRWRPAPG